MEEKETKPLCHVAERRINEILEEIRFLEYGIKRLSLDLGSPIHGKGEGRGDAAALAKRLEGFKEQRGRSIEALAIACRVLPESEGFPVGPDEFAKLAELAGYVGPDGKWDGDGDPEYHDRFPDQPMPRTPVIGMKISYSRFGEPVSFRFQTPCIRYEFCESDRRRDWLDEPIPRRPHSDYVIGGLQDKVGDDMDRMLDKMYEILDPLGLSVEIECVSHPTYRDWEDIEVDGYGDEYERIRRSDDEYWDDCRDWDGYLTASDDFVFEIFVHPKDDEIWEYDPKKRDWAIRPSRK